MARLPLILCILQALVFPLAPGAFGAPNPVSPQGLLVYKDPQTGYVEAFEYTTSRPTNAFATRYILVGGITRNAQNAGVIEDIKYPAPSVPPASAAQLDEKLKKLESLTRQYPQQAALLGNAAARLRNALTSVPQGGSRPSTPPGATGPTGTSGPRPPPAPTPPLSSSGGAVSFALKSGVRFQDARIASVGPDRLSVIHKSGVAEILFDELPDDPAGLPEKVKALIAQSRKTKSESRLFAAALQEKSAKAAAAQQIRLADEAQKARQEVERISKETGEKKTKPGSDIENVRRINFEVERRLKPEKFGVPGPTNADMYQIRIYAAGKQELAILETNETHFEASGTATMYVSPLRTLSVELDGGFQREVTVYWEAPKEEAQAAEAKYQEQRKQRSRLAELKAQAENAGKRQQTYEYATRKFSALPLAPVFHVSGRLQALGFQAQVASAEWNKIVALVGEADWEGLIKAALGPGGKMGAPEDVDAAFARLIKQPVSVSIRSDQLKLLVFHGNGYLEQPAQHRTASIGALSLPAQSDDLVGGRGGDALELAELPDVRSLSDQVHPDGNGYLAQWKPTDSDMFFFVKVAFPETGEKTASEEIEALRRAVRDDAVRIKHRQQLGELPEKDAAAQIKQSIRRYFDSAGGALLSNY